MNKKIAWLMVLIPVIILFTIGCIFSPIMTLFVTAIVIGLISVSVGSAWLLSN